MKKRNSVSYSFLFMEVKLSTLILLKYNNYYNRITKSENTLEAYRKYRLTDSSNRISEFYNINWNPNDGVSTSMPVNWFGQEADYAVVSDDDIHITSRWFIIEQKRNLRGQNLITFKRDTIADYWSQILQSPVYVEKGIAKDSDPAIFNLEDLSVNQIKNQEVLLNDITGCPWIVGYYARKDNAGQPVSLTGDFTIRTSADIVYNNINDFPWFSIVNQEKKYCEGMNLFSKFKIRRKDNTFISNYLFNTHILKNDKGAVSLEDFSHLDEPYYNSNYGTLDFAVAPSISSNPTDEDLLEDIARVIDDATGTLNINYNIGAVCRDFVGYLSKDNYFDILSYNGKIIRDTTSSKSYRVSVETSKIKNDTYKLFSSTVATEYNDYIQESLDHQSAYLNVLALPGDTWGLNITGETTFTIYLKELDISYTKFSYDINAANKIQTTDAVYDMFCLPYSDDFTTKIGDETYVSSKDISMMIATGIGTNEGSKLYDLQLVPYCPLVQKMSVEKEFTVVDSYLYSFVYSQDAADSQSTPKVAAVIFNVPSSNFKTQVKYPITVINKKMDNETKVYRLNSPNYNGIYEFSPAMNDGVDYFDIECTYKPYTPYIHVSPNFKNLYGKDFDDARGLICGGDFSLPLLQSEWKQYEINNKNYLNAFDREIQYDKTRRDINNLSNAANIVGGVVSLATGNLSGASSLASGIGSMATSYLSTAAAIDYKTDQFNYSLENVQARPASLAKVGPFNINNKYIPFLEIYDCTDTEKIAFANKIKYNGMKIMRIGKISDFINKWNYYAGNVSVNRPYIKGKLINLEDSTYFEDFHITNDIANELNNGVYVELK